jgi:hypothetical protein
MVLYNCIICLKEFKKKDDYIKHTERRKTPCQPPHKILTPPIEILIKNENNNVNNDILCCDFCGLIFNRKDNLKRHMEKFCKIKKLKEDEEEKDKENIFKLLLAKEEEMKKKDEEIKKINEENKKNINKLEDYVKKLTDMNIELNNKVGKLLEKMSVNNITNNNITNNTNNNIINISKDKLVNFGEEDVKEIELKLFSNCFNKFGKHIFEASAKNIWFNKSKNKNFYISDLSRDKAMTYKNGQFYLTPINTVLTTINQQLYKYFKHNIDEIKKTGNKKLMEKVENEILQAYKMFFNAFDDKDRFVPNDERLEEFTRVINKHLTKFFSSVKKDIISNYENIKKDVLDDNLLKQIGYEAPKKGRGRPKKITNTEEIKINSIPKSISGKNEIKNMLEDINNKLDGKIINDDKKKTTNTKKNKEFDSDDEFIKIGNTRKGGFEK